MSFDISNMPKLGFGLMRLPRKDEKIDMERVCPQHLLVIKLMKEASEMLDKSEE